MLLLCRSLILCKDRLLPYHLIWLSSCQHKQKHGHGSSIREYRKQFSKNTKGECDNLCIYSNVKYKSLLTSSSRRIRLYPLIPWTASGVEEIDGHILVRRTLTFHDVHVVSSIDSWSNIVPIELHIKWILSIRNIDHVYTWLKVKLIKIVENVYQSGRCETHVVQLWRLCYWDFQFIEYTDLFEKIMREMIDS